MITNKYDAHIRQHVGQYITSFKVDWRWLKAQFHCESNLNPDAVSHVGASGIAQFMPATWEQMCDELWSGKRKDIFDPVASIEAGCYYMNKLAGKWNAPRPAMDRWCLAMASYNAGMANLLKAQKLANGVNDFARIIKRLPDVTGQHSVDTKNYIKRIFDSYSFLVRGY